MENKQIKKRIPVISLLLREKKFLINTPFQIQFMASLIIVSLVSMGIIYIANDYFFHSYIAAQETACVTSKLLGKEVLLSVLKSYLLSL